MWLRHRWPESKPARGRGRVRSWPLIILFCQHSNTHAADRDRFFAARVTLHKYFRPRNVRRAPNYCSCPRPGKSAAVTVLTWAVRHRFSAKTSRPWVLTGRSFFSRGFSDFAGHARPRGRGGDTKQLSLGTATGTHGPPVSVAFLPLRGRHGSASRLFIP